MVLRFGGLIFWTITALVLFALAAMLVFSEISLPEWADELPPGDYEGSPFHELNSSLIRIDSDQTSGEKEGRRVIVLNEPWGYVHYRSVRDKNVELQMIPVGAFFVSDFASVPFPANRIINPFGRHAEAAILHDWLYALGVEGKRKEADITFYRAMKINGVNWLRRRLMYSAVRIGGRAAYGRPSEWKFYNPTVGAELIDACVIMKPTSVSDTTVSFAPQQNDEWAQQVGAYGDVWGYLKWKEKFQNPECRAYLFHKFAEGSLPAREELQFFGVNSLSSFPFIAVPADNAIDQKKHAAAFGLWDQLNQDFLTECALAVELNSGITTENDIVVRLEDKEPEILVSIEDFFCNAEISARNPISLEEVLGLNDSLLQE